jgi:hypothetical protein
MSVNADGQVAQIAPGGVIQLNPPASLDDATWDSLFPADGTQTVVAPTQQVKTQPVGTQLQGQTQTQTQTNTQTTEPFLKGTKSVYKTPEAAVQGLNQKDALIDQLRQRYALTTGLDPITNQPVGQALQPQVDQNNYAANPTKYMDDLFASTKVGPEAYARVQSKFIMDNLSPLAPLIAESAKAQALTSVAKDNAEIPKFIGTEDYQATLEANPDLKIAVTTAESNPDFHSRLPGLYKLAYLTGQGMQLPKILAAATVNTNTSTQTQTTQQVRTTMQNPSLGPSTQATGAQASFKDIGGIREVIRQMESKGVNLTSW